MSNGNELFKLRHISGLSPIFRQSEIETREDGAFVINKHGREWVVDEHTMRGPAGWAHLMYRHTGEFDKWGEPIFDGSIMDVGDHMPYVVVVRKGMGWAIHTEARPEYDLRSAEAAFGADGLKTFDDYAKEKQWVVAGHVDTQLPIKVKPGGKVSAHAHPYPTPPTTEIKHS